MYKDKTIENHLVFVSRKIDEGGIAEPGYTTSKCIKEKEPEREINPPWGRNYKGFLYSPREVLS